MSQVLLEDSSSTDRVDIGTLLLAAQAEGAAGVFYHPQYHGVSVQSVRSTLTRVQAVIEAQTATGKLTVPLMARKVKVATDCQLDAAQHPVLVAVTDKSGKPVMADGKPLMAEQKLPAPAQVILSRVDKNGVKQSVPLWTVYVSRITAAAQTTPEGASQ